MEQNMLNLYPEVHCYLQADEAHRGQLESVWRRVTGGAGWLWSSDKSSSDVVFGDVSFAGAQSTEQRELGVEMFVLPELTAPAYEERVLEQLQRALWQSDSAVALAWRSAAKTLGPDLPGLEVQAGVSARAWLYQAKEVNSGARRILKCQPTANGNLEREVQALMLLGGECAPRCLQLGGWSGTPVIVMEALEPLEVGSEAAALSALDALQHLLATIHGKGWVHGDIKPEHIMQTDSGELRLIDWDCAWHASCGQRHGSWEGTPQYMAPELFTRGQHPTPASDYYALGAVVFDWLLGAVPAGVLRDASPMAAHEWRRASLANSVSELGEHLRNWLAEAPERRLPNIV